MEQNDVIVIDVQPVEEFNQAHIKGARSNLLPERENRRHEIPRDVEIVAYGRGPYFVLAPEAIAVPGAAGYHVLRPDEGQPEWRSRLAR